MKDRIYFYVGTAKPVHALSEDDWGVKHLYLNDDLHEARESRDSFNKKRRPGSRLYRIYRIRFTEVA